jgi:hypothetical protein
MRCCPIHRGSVQLRCDPSPLHQCGQQGAYPGTRGSQWSWTHVHQAKGGPTPRSCRAGPMGIKLGPHRLT